MTTLLQFIARISIVLYILVAAGIFFSIRGLVQVSQARRVAVFGLEREAVALQRRRLISTLITLLLLASVIYVVERIVVPNLGETAQAPTPTPIVFVTQSATATPALLLFPTVTPVIGLPPVDTTTQESASGEGTTGGCGIIGATITSPLPGETVSGQVRVQGEANILNFALYKFEVNGPSTAGTWVVVQTYNVPVVTGQLGVWDSTSFVPGNYTLRLVVFSRDGTFVLPCEVPIVIAGREGTPSPAGP